jgi:hypothetical protein
VPRAISAALRTKKASMRSMIRPRMKRASPLRAFV